MDLPVFFYLLLMRKCVTHLANGNKALHNFAGLNCACARPWIELDWIDPNRIECTPRVLRLVFSHNYHQLDLRIVTNFRFSSFVLFFVQTKIENWIYRKWFEWIWNRMSMEWPMIDITLICTIIHTQKCANIIDLCASFIREFAYAPCHVIMKFGFFGIHVQMTHLDSKINWSLKSKLKLNWIGWLEWMDQSTNQFRYHFMNFKLLCATKVIVIDAIRRHVQAAWRTIKRRRRW